MAEEQMDDFTVAGEMTGEEARAQREATKIDAPEFEEDFTIGGEMTAQEWAEHRKGLESDFDAAIDQSQRPAGRDPLGDDGEPPMDPEAHELNFLSACRRGDAKAVASTLHEFDSLPKDALGEDALAYAVAAKSIECVALLADKSQNPQDALMSAVEARWMPGVEALAHYGDRAYSLETPNAGHPEWDIEIESTFMKREMKSPLIRAAEMGWTHGFEAMGKSCDAEALNSDGLAALVVLTTRGGERERVAQFEALALSADPATPGLAGRILRAAVASGPAYAKAADAALSNDSARSASATGSTALMIAASRGDFDRVETLIARSDLKAVDQHEKNAAAHAKSSGHDALSDYLTAYSAAMDEKSELVRSTSRAPSRSRSDDRGMRL